MDSAGPEDFAPLPPEPGGVVGVSVLEGEALPDKPFEEPRRFPSWPIVLAIVLVVLGAALAWIWPVNLPYYALAPGPAYDIDDFVTVEGDTGGPGELFFLTVSLDEVNLYEYVSALFDPEIDLREREAIRPVGVSEDALRRQNLDLMQQSQRDAIFVALDKLGYEVTLEGTGALVNEIMAESAADGVLETGDVVIEINGEQVEFASDLVDLVGSAKVGETVEIVIDRGADEGASRLDFTLVLGPHVDDPERGMLGVVISNADEIVSFPVDIDIDSQNIGGPSAGLMFSLQIMDQLGDGDIAKGNRIAGTGTISRDGQVGPIGGVQQKVFGALNVGADYMLVPEANFAEASEIAPDDIQLVSIGHIDEAIAFLDSL